MPNSYNSSHTGEWQDDLFNLIYPIGSVYISVNNVSPATLFGGTWEQIQDKFIMCAGLTYEAGTSGGSITSGEPSNNISGGTAITIAQMPSHRHDEVLLNGDTNWYLGGGNWHKNAPSRHPIFSSAMNATTTSFQLATSYTGSGAEHTHTLSSHTHDTTPPYIALYVWKRTA